jgi:CNT family concentrative nucleoside transporter
LLITFFLRENKSLKFDKNFRIVICGVAFQILIAFALTNLPFFTVGLEKTAAGVMKLRDAAIEGTKFVFGYIGGGELPFEMKSGTSAFVFAFQALPTVIIIGALSAILTHLKILPFLAKIFGYLFKLVFRVKSSIGMVSAAKVFFGQFDSALLIKPSLPHFPRSDIFIILALAFATTSAATMPIYADVLRDVCPNAMEHIIMSSVISVISVLILCSIIMPPAEGMNINNDMCGNETKKPYSSFMEALQKGLSDGAYVWWCVVGILIGTTALIAFINYILDIFPDCGGLPITLQRMVGFFMYPFAWIIGIQEQDLSSISQILGVKLVLNETIAFFDLAKANVSGESVIKTIYAINNFGNFSCIGMTAGGLLALAPNQKCITELIGKAFFVGILATFLTSTLMNIVISF